MAPKPASPLTVFILNEWSLNWYITCGSHQTNFQKFILNLLFNKSSLDIENKWYRMAPKPFLFDTKNRNRIQTEQNLIDWFTEIPKPNWAILDQPPTPKWHRTEVLNFGNYLGTEGMQATLPDTMTPDPLLSEFRPGLKFSIFTIRCHFIHSWNLVSSENTNPGNPS